MHMKLKIIVISTVLTQALIGASLRLTGEPIESRLSGTGSGTIQGTVIDSVTGKPISAAVVRIVKNSTVSGARTRNMQVETNGDGRFVALSLPEGQYLVSRI